MTEIEVKDIKLSASSVKLSISVKGVYTWEIRVAKEPNQVWDDVIKELDDVNNKLKEKYGVDSDSGQYDDI